MPGGHGDKLDHMRERAIAALLGTTSVRKAAVKSGIAERTLRKWLKQEAFAAAYQQARRHLLDNALESLQKACGRAVQTLVRKLRCGHAPTEVRAALGILDQAVKTAQMVEMEERLAALEELARGRTP